MPFNLADIEAFRAAARDGARPTGGVMRASAAPPIVPTDDSRTVRFCFSDGSVDRCGDTISPDGWDTAAFRQNPVALWAHDSYSPPIGRASNIKVEGGRLMGDIVFASAEQYPLAETIFQLTKAGFLSAVSVGFLPTEWEWSTDKARPYGIDFKKQELLEISVCPVPANAHALAEARAAGIDTGPVVRWAEELLDRGGHALVTKAELTALRSAAQLRADGMSNAGGDNPGNDDDEDDDLAAAPSGNCGRGPAAECGMKDPAECMIHAPLDKALAGIVAKLDREAVAEVLATARGLASGQKAGRVLSKANEDALHQARDLVDAVLNQISQAESPADSGSDEKAVQDAADADARLRQAQALARRASIALA